MPGVVVDAFYESKVKQVNNETWGHLKPKKDNKYYGYILFSYGVYGDICPILLDFKDLDDSPWFYDHMSEFVSDECKEEGTIYKFKGYYKFKKDNDYSFVGDITKVTVDI